MTDNKWYWNHDAPFYAHWTYQRSPDGVINLAWWTYDISGGDGWNIMRLVQNIDQMKASAYGDIDELHNSRGKILISILNDADGGSRSWPILPTQDVSLSDYQHG